MINTFFKEVKYMEIGNIGCQSVTGVPAYTPPSHTKENITVPLRDSVTLTGKAPVHKEEIPKEDIKETASTAEPAPQTPAEDPHFKPPYPVTQEGKLWILNLPGGQKVPCPQKPVWLARIDQMNSVLDQNPNPAKLRKFHDEIADVSAKAYNAGNKEFKLELLEEVINRVDDLKTAQDLKTIFDMKLADETQSTYRVGGTLAGSLCSEMAKYGHIQRTLEKRLMEIGS